jgi:dTDP-glucose pyrophosphorylase
MSYKLNDKIFLLENALVRDAISCIESNKAGIVLILSNKGVLQGSITDGDIRRGLLKGFNLECPISKIIQRNVVVVSANVTSEEVKHLMVVKKLLQIPIVDAGFHVIGLHVWDDISKESTISNHMVIMAGGMGKRLLPITEKTPKPMLLIEGKPMLELIIERAKFEGFNRFLISTHYLAEIIEAYFGDGSQFGVKIDYLREKLPLGTAGALSKFNPLPNIPFVVTNADVITGIRYRELLNFHIQNVATATMAVRFYELRNPFGVVKTEGIEIIGFEEKPVTCSSINAGVYVLDPKALSSLTYNEYCDMPTLFERLREKSERVIAYPIHESWIDVGRPADLAQVNDLYKNNGVV